MKTAKAQNKIVKKLSSGIQKPQSRETKTHRKR